jgi:hypothetical protein
MRPRRRPRSRRPGTGRRHGPRGRPTAHGHRGLERRDPRRVDVEDGEAVPPGQVPGYVPARDPGETHRPARPCSEYPRRERRPVEDDRGPVDSLAAITRRAPAMVMVDTA